MKVRKACHCSYRIRYHMVFVVKYRRGLVTSQVFDFMKHICKGIEKRYFLRFDALGYENDYIHLVVEGAPRYSPSRIMQICKSVLAIQVFKEFPKIKEEELWGGEFWTDGGHIDTIGDGRGLDEVKKYVKNQGRDSSQLLIYEFIDTPQLAAE
ncbi:MAG: IS200/IS605 family transposase [Candidatus Woesearchaeota archaeon]|nr:IS200/IS605 family transposase [Candidatus Woesearchaeota archaeon]